MEPVNEKLPEKKHPGHEGPPSPEKSIKDLISNSYIFKPDKFIRIEYKLLLVM